MLTSYVLFVSIQLNALVFLYAVLRKIIHSSRTGSTSINNGSLLSSTTTTTTVCISKLFPCEEITNIKKERHTEHVKARGMVNSVASCLIFGLSLDIIFSTDLIRHPFIGNSHLILIGNLSVISLCVFNLVLSVATYRKIRNVVHHFCRYSVTLSILLTTIWLNEMHVCTIIAMVTVGAVVTDEIKNIKQQQTDRQGHRFFLTFHLVVSYLCLLLLPVTVVCVTMGYTRQDFFQTHLASQTVFFLASTFFLWYNLWRLKKITYDYIAERASMHARKMLVNDDLTVTNICVVSDTKLSNGHTTFTSGTSRKKIAPLETIKIDNNINDFELVCQF